MRILARDNPKESVLRPTFAAPEPVLHVNRMRSSRPEEAELGTAFGMNVLLLLPFPPACE